MKRERGGGESSKRFSSSRILELRVVSSPEVEDIFAREKGRKIGAKLIRERKEERRRRRGVSRSELKKLTSDRETPGRPIKGNDIFIIEINCGLTARCRAIKGRMAAAGRAKLKF